MNTELTQIRKIWSWKRVFQIDDHCSFRTNHQKMRKTKRFQASNKWLKKQLFGIKTKCPIPFFKENLAALEIKNNKYPWIKQYIQVYQ